MGGKNIYFLESPFQILCAVEHSLSSVDSTVCNSSLSYIRLNKLSRNNLQLKAMENELLMGKAKYLSNKRFFSFLRFFILIFLNKNSFMKSTTWVVGDYGSKFARLIRLLRSLGFIKNIVYLDDGVATLLYVKRGFLKNERVFSMFSHIEFGCKELSHNSFENIRQNKFLSSVKSVSAFIGQKLSLAGFCTDDDYYKILTQFFNMNPEIEWLYIPHRGESDNAINKISKLPNVSLMKLEYCVEYYFLREMIHPIRVASFISSALLTLKTIFPNSECISIQSSCLDFSRISHLEEIKSAFQEKGIKRIKIEKGEL
jgi:hypothetical protein